MLEDFINLDSITGPKLPPSVFSGVLDRIEGSSAVLRFLHSTSSLLVWAENTIFRKIQVWKHAKFDEAICSRTESILPGRLGRSLV